MIALSSELSRRSAEKAIAEGRVSVNGAVVTLPGTIVDPSKDNVCVDGKKLLIPQEHHYLAFYKPCGYLVTKSDPEGRPTIWDQLPEWKGRLNSVGRLDYNSDGLLILTDDGDFLNMLTHPRHEIWKTYRVRVKGVPEPMALEKLRKGVHLEDGLTLPAKVCRVDKGEPNALLEISIREGRNRQVRRMCDEVNLPVVRLTRVAIGDVVLGGLKPGQWRHLSKDEVKGLM